VRLRGEVIDLVGAHLLDDRAHPGAVAQVAVVQLQRRRTWAEALAHMVDTSGGEARGAAHHAVHFVALLDEKFREVRAVLPGNPGYQRNFGHQLYSVSRPRRLVAGDETMRVAVEVLGGELVQLGVLQRFHLVHQPQRNVHALAGDEFELLDNLGVG
jgi:hypothetical protein